MNISDIIAVVALLVSVLSAWTSFVAYRYSVRVKEEEMRLAFSREKAEFLVRLDKARGSFDRLQRQITDQLSKLDNCPEPARSGLAKELTLLKSDLNYLGGCQRQVWSLWEETYEMTQSGLAHHKPRFLKLVEDDESFARSAYDRCERIEATLNERCHNDAAEVSS